MQRIIFSSLVVPALIMSGSAWAQSESNSEERVQTTTTVEAREVTRGYLTNEVVGIKPQLGVMVFKDQLGDTTSRAAAGVTVDANMATMVNKDWSRIFLGPSVGVIASHFGQAGSNMIGTGSDVAVGSSGANTLVLPANLKAGYNITDNIRVSAHGGGNVVYRSVANSINMGSANSGTTGSNWSMFPNVGADAEFGLGKNIALMVRPDWTITPGDTLFTGTVAMAIPIG